ncbi:MAG: hypothetical protein AB7K67_15865 [Hyphomicrobiaceae bacterium]
MISIQSGMLLALGFLAAGLLALLVAPALWARAVRITTQRIKQNIPVSGAEIRADRDRMKAEFAVRVHRLEKDLEETKLARTRQLIEINRRDARISALETQKTEIGAILEENQNARRVLELTISDRLPKVEARLAEAKKLLFDRDRELAELTQAARRQGVALEEATTINAQQQSEIDRLSTALTTRGNRNRQSLADPRFEGELALRSEIDALRAKTREQASLINRLQSQIGRGGFARHEADLPGSAADASQERARDTLAEAESSLRLVRIAASGTEPGPASQLQRELQALKAKTEDQASEISRLKAALDTFEHGEATGLKDSKIALKARLSAAVAQSEQQANTIRKVRAELVAANERLARQSAHYMEEMRRLGVGTLPASGQARRSSANGARRTLAERIAEHARTQARPGPAADEVQPPKASVDTRIETAREGPAPEQPPAAELQPEPSAEFDTSAPEKPKAAEPVVVEAEPMPAAPKAEIADPAPVPQRRPRLFDRITNIAAKN